MIGLFIEIGCLGTFNVKNPRKIEKFEISNPGGLCLLQPVKDGLRTILYCLKVILI